MRLVEAESLTLTREEIIEITGYKQVRKQKSHFDRLGVPNIIRPDNTLSVAREHYIQKPLCGLPQQARPSVRTIRRVIGKTPK